MEEIEQALSQFRATGASYRLYEEYYQGRHRLAFATEKFRNAFGSLFRAFADNLCPSVVDAVSDRLTALGFAIEEGPEAASGQAWQLWLANRMDRSARELHVEALRSGDAYLIVWPDRDNRPTLYPNTGAAMRVCYDEEQPGTVLWATKLWRLGDGRLRLTMYFPDRIEKYVSVSKAAPFQRRPARSPPLRRRACRGRCRIHGDGRRCSTSGTTPAWGDRGARS